MEKGLTYSLLLVFVLVFVSGCASDKPTPPAIRAAQIKPATEAAKQAEAQQAPAGQISDPWPTDIPSEVPKYEGGSLNRISKPDTAQKKVSVMIDNTNEETYRNYVKKLQDSGFVKTIEISDDSQTMFSGKKDKIEVSAVYNKKSKSTLIMSLRH
jgi:hypothetical protein